MSRSFALLLLLAFPIAVRADDLPTVKTVEAQPLLAQVKRLVTALAIDHGDRLAIDRPRAIPTPRADLLRAKIRDQYLQIIEDWPVRENIPTITHKSITDLTTTRDNLAAQRNEARHAVDTLNATKPVLRRRAEHATRLAAANEHLTTAQKGVDNAASILADAKTEQQTRQQYLQRNTPALNTLAHNELRCV